MAASSAKHAICTNASRGTPMCSRVVDGWSRARTRGGSTICCSSYSSYGLPSRISRGTDYALDVVGTTVSSSSTAAYST